MAEELVPGLYERLITSELRELLREASVKWDSQSRPLDAADSYLAFVRHLASLLVRALRSVQDEQRQAEIVNRVIAVLRDEVPRAFAATNDDVASPPELLLAVAARTTEVLDVFLRDRPTIPLSQMDLLTNARGEPTIGGEISRELESADNVDLLCAFVRWHGFRVLRDALERFFKRGGRLRLLTTTYMGTTEQVAVDAFAALGADIKIAYETQSTRLHAKAWLFERHTGFTTGFIGSSNLSRAALLDGLEWNVRISAIDSPALVEKFGATFESYWESDSFEPYDPAEDSARLRDALHAKTPQPDINLAVLDVQPYPHQRRILELLQVERERHDRHRNLVVAATGTGKTIVAGLDYRKLREQYANAKLLFVAHRREILRQSRSTFRAIVRDGAFGELYVDGDRPDLWTHVFASIQSLSSLSIEEIDPQHFDVVIVDEFHHAAAPTYRRLLDHLRPRELLGLTATPERADGVDITEWFGGRIAAEIRLWEALEEGLLVPFQYFGIHDDVTLEALEWKRGGYATTDLEEIYTGNDARTAKVLSALVENIPNPREMRALGFCVSIAHASYMAERFSAAGVPAEALTAQTPSHERDAALRRLRQRDTNIIFSVDLFNEGLDIPEVDTVLFLRPTESATVFLQQLGRGLRKTEDKPCLTVLDFIGQQHRRFRFDERFRGLSGGTRREIAKQVEEDFPFLPAGCHISLDRVAKEIVLGNVRQAIGTKLSSLVDELRSMGDVSLSHFLDEADVSPEDLYRGGRTWSVLRRAARLQTAPEGPQEQELSRALGRVLHVDDPKRIDAWRRALRQPEPGEVSSTSERDQRLLTMLHFDLWGTTNRTSLNDSLAKLWGNQAIRMELAELLEVLGDRAEHVLHPLREPVGTPLMIHSRYTRDEILAGLGSATSSTPKALREGAFFDRPTSTDVFFVTLEKNEKHYSPTTLYQDYAISADLFHWESQATTSERSPTAQRYIHRARPLLFIRERRANESGTTLAYLFAGPATYVNHERERPIAFTWKLEYPLPADFFEVARVAAG